MRLESSLSNTSRLCTSFTVSPLCLRRNQCSWRLPGGYPLSSRMHETHFWPEHFHQFSPLSQSQPEGSSSTRSTGGQSLMPSVSLGEIMNGLKTKGRLCRSPCLPHLLSSVSVHNNTWKQKSSIMGAQTKECENTGEAWKQQSYIRLWPLHIVPT